MKASVFWTQRARSDFLAIKAYLQERSPRGARRIARSILRRARRLSRFPASGRVVPEFACLKPDLREIIVGKYRLVYCLAPGSGKTARVVILTVFHARREFPELIGAFEDRLDEDAGSLAAEIHEARREYRAGKPAALSK